MSTNKENEIGNMQNIVIQKSELLNILKDNKERHDAVLEVARAGYTETAKKEIEKKKTEFIEAIKDFTNQFDFEINKLEDKIKQNKLNFRPILNIELNFNAALNLQYPEDHTKDYERAIRAVELNVYDKITLNQREFESYVLNNWDWKDSFLANNSLYSDTGRDIIRAASVKSRYANQLNDTSLEDVFERKVDKNV